MPILAPLFFDMKNLISTTFYGYFNYVIALVTLSSPWLFNFWHVGGASLFLPMAFGWFQLIMAIFSVNKAGFMKVFPNQMHHLLDVFCGFWLLVAPFFYGFCDRVMWPHVILGAIFLIVGICTKNSPFTNRATEMLPEAGIQSLDAHEGRIMH